MFGFLRFLLFSTLILFGIGLKASDSVRISGLFQQMSIQPELRDSFLGEAEKMIQKNPDLQEVFDYNQARFSILTGDHQSAKEQIETKIEKLKDEKNSLYLARYYNLLASVYAYLNEQEQVIEFYQKAIEIFESNGANDDAAMIYFNLANIFLGRLDYLSARESIKKSRELLDPKGNLEYNSFVYALLAVTSLKVEEETEEALRNANKALEIAEEIQSIQGLILSNYALGEAYNFKHNFKEAIHHFEVAADLAEKYRLLNILISSQAGLVQSYINTDDYQSAIRYGKLALNNAERIENNEIKFNLYKNIALSYAHLVRHDSAYYYSTIALDEYLYKVNEDNQRIIQEYLVKYETEKKENLILKQDRDLRQKQNWILLLSSVIILGLIGFVFYRKYIHLKTLKLKEEKEKEVLLSIDLGERKERKRLSRELHDGVASQLTAVKLLLESGNPTRQSQKALEVIKEVQKEIRDVAYSILPVDFERVPLHQAIRKFCYQISIPELKVHFFSNVEELELEKTTAHSLYRAVQEIIQNAIKHAQANSIHVQFIEKSGELEISIEDNGLGFDTEILNQENTLRFLIDRLSLIDARLEVESFPNQGAVFNITKKLSK